MESRIIYNINKFIAFLFGEKNKNDPEQIIYNKLLRLEGEELEDWMNAKIKKYITGKGYQYDFQGVEFEGIEGRFTFQDWYWFNIYNGTGEAMSQDEIYGEQILKPLSLKEEYKIIVDKIQIIKNYTVYYIQEVDWAMAICIDYLEMYIMTMNSENLKEYIIQQVNRFK